MNNKLENTYQEVKVLKIWVHIRIKRTKELSYQSSNLNDFTFAYSISSKKYLKNALKT